MSDMAITLPVEKISKKQIRKSIQQKLSETLADYRALIGDKKFENRIRKAARLIGAEVRVPRIKKVK